MRLRLDSPFKSILQLEACELPDFSVLLGRNGAGKSQLLSGIYGRQITGAVHKLDAMEGYDITSFRIRSSESAGYGSSLFAETTAQRFLVRTGDQSPSELAHEIFDHVIERHGLAPGTRGRQEFEKVARPFGPARDFQRVGTTEASFADQDLKHVEEAILEYTRDIESRVIEPLALKNQNRRGSRQEPQGFGNDPSLLVSMAMQLAGKLAHEIDRGDILRAAHYEGDMIANTLSHAFTRYKAEQYSWAITLSERGEGDVGSLMDAYRRKNAPPWEILREVLASMRDAAGGEGVFDFEFTDPENDRLSHATHSQYAFQAELTNRTTGARYKVEDLSSGETVLMTLCMTWFNQSMGRKRPALLLLDEVDAMLHPSMTAALVSCLKDLFVRNGTKVIMASHCPATAAVLDEGEVFRVSRDGDLVRIRPVARSEAVEELSDGIATLDTGLRIATADDSLVTIITEGKNSLVLDRWARLHFPDDVSVFDKLPDRTGADQLQGYARILSKMQPASLLLFVWDCDQQRKVRKLNKELPQDSRVTMHVLAHRDNDIAPVGIENKFDEDVLLPFSERVADAVTGDVIRVSLSNRKMTPFAEHIHQNGSVEDFKHFQELHQVVSRLVKEERSKRVRR